MGRIECGGGMAATPFGAHQAGPHRADHVAGRYAPDHDVIGACRRKNASRHSFAPAGPPVFFCSVLREAPLQGITEDDVDGAIARHTEDEMDHAVLFRGTHAAGKES